MRKQALHLGEISEVYASCAVVCRAPPVRQQQSTASPEELLWDRGRVHLAEERLTAAAPYTWTLWAVATSA